MRAWNALTMSLAAAVAAASMIACTTTVVNFAVTDGGAGEQSVVRPSDASSTDAPAADALGGAEPTPDASIVAPRVLTSAEFDGVPFADPARYVQYKCCTEDKLSCLIVVQGDDLTCRDTATWTLSATRDCESRGLTAQGVGLYVGC